MKAWLLVFRSLRFYWRTHLGVLLGAAMGSTVLVGALTVGDSVRCSLLDMALSRLGQTEFALASGDRFFRRQLADDMAGALASLTLAAPTPGPKEPTPLIVAPVLHVGGVGISGGGTARANQIQAFGVDDRFWSLSPSSQIIQLTNDEAAVNQALAQRLGLRAGEDFVVRLEKVGFLPLDAPLAMDKNVSLALHVTVKAVVSDDALGSFNLQANPQAPLNVFLSWEWLSDKLELAHRANLMLVGGRSARTLTVEDVNGILEKKWQLADAGLELLALPDLKAIELRSNRVFLEAPVAEVALRAGRGAQGVFSYFVNHFRAGQRTTPYSMIAAPGEPLVPAGMADDEVIINDWLARDLGMSSGSRLEIAYYVLGPTRQLIEKTNAFRVRSVIPLAGLAADRALMPQFPGLADAANCRDWKPGIPIDLSQIRQQDEAYWDDYRGTPKALVTLSAAQRMWANRFGNLTAVRYRLEEAQTAASLSNQLRSQLNPSTVGLRFLPVREEAVKAGTGAVDFGQLFLGLSFFLVIAALLLTGLLFVLGVEQRAEEMGTLLALGFSGSLIRRLWLAEGAVLAFLGAVLGLAGGVVYTKAVLIALGSIWRGAAAHSTLHFHRQSATLLLGIVAGFGMAMMSMWAAIRRQARKSVVDLQMAGAAGDIARPAGQSRISRFLTMICMAGVVVVLVRSDPGRGPEAAGAFFGAGFLALIGSLTCCHLLLRRMGLNRSAATISLVLLGVRNCARRRGRSMATIALTSCGIFLVVAVAANRQDPLHGAQRRESGTGGFALYAETSLPVLADLNSLKGKESFGLDTREFAPLRFVSLKVRAGDDASCLNLYRAQQPRLLGVRPEELAERGAFAFSTASPGVDRRNPWLALNQEWGDDVVPAVADQTVIEWGLRKSIGDTVDYVGEDGRRFKVKLIGGLVNSVLQGSLLISDKAFQRRYPSVGGFQVFLVDAPMEKANELIKALSLAMQDVGWEAQPTTLRLAAFSTVENTYLSIFLALGGLGLVLGSVGMGVVALRNILERRGELALLRAVGFSQESVHRLLLYEHGLLLAIGCVCGGSAAVVAALPALVAPGMEVPSMSVLFWLGGTILIGALGIGLATRVIVRGNLLSSLRDE